MAELTALRREGESIALTWSDGVAHALQPRALRILCPCAFCVSEVTGERLIDPDSIAQDLRLVDMQPVGNYAYRLLFSDGHDSGLYRIDLLHELCLAGQADQNAS